MEESNSRGRDKFRKYKKMLELLASFYRLFPISIRKKMLDLYRNKQGNIGYAIRYSLLKSICIHCGDNVSIAPGAYIFNAQNLDLGSNISIHPMCYIECGPFDGSYIKIDDNVSIAHGTTIICTSHTYKHDTIKIIKDMPIKYEPIHICENVWIGAKVTVLCGVEISTGCVIGANSVLTGSTEPNGIYVGAPAHRIKSRV